MKYFSLCSLSAMMLMFGSSFAIADFLPTVAGVVHQDTFIDGWPAPIFPPPIVVTPGNGALPDPEYDVVPPGTSDFIIGLDSLVSPSWYAHETEIDLDPFSDQGAFMDVLFDFGVMQVARQVPLAGGPEIYLNWITPDFASNGETGVFFTGLINHSDIQAAVGVSVVEGPASLGNIIQKVVEFPNASELNFTVTEPLNTLSGWRINNGQSGVIITQTAIPEPASVSMLLLALGGLTMLKRRGF